MAPPSSGNSGDWVNRECSMQVCEYVCTTSASMPFCVTGLQLDRTLGRKGLNPPGPNWDHTPRCHPCRICLPIQQCHMDDMFTTQSVKLCIYAPPPPSAIARIDWVEPRHAGPWEWVHNHNICCKKSGQQLYYSILCRRRKHTGFFPSDVDRPSSFVCSYVPKPLEPCSGNGYLIFCVQGFGFLMCT